MREILFKAKRLDNGEWVEGYYVKAELLDCSGCEHFIIEYSAKGSIHLIDPKTVCQYTGLTDKNGNKIFEGDICLFDDYSGLVSYSEEDGMFVFTYEENDEINFGQIYGSDLEVIGNIHDK